MKVYELMKLLEQFPAGNEVFVNVCGTLNSSIADVEVDDEGVYVSGEPAEIVGADGEVVGFSNEQ